MTVPPALLPNTRMQLTDNQAQHNPPLTLKASETSDVIRILRVVRLGLTIQRMFARRASLVHQVRRESGLTCKSQLEISILPAISGNNLSEH